MNQPYTTATLIAALNNAPVDFQSVMQVIENEYVFSPTRFENGQVINEANENNGSCKIFAFARLNGLSKQATLNAFGAFYTQDVLGHPEGEDHQNIRNFMLSGWDGVRFDGEALKTKS